MAPPGGPTLLLLLLLLLLLGFVSGSPVPGGCVAPSGQSCLRVGAFNVKTFGKSKMSNSTLAGYIADVVQRYDILVLQEIRDISLWAQEHLLTLLRQTHGDFDMILSKRLGRTSYKEQYGFFFRGDRVSAIQNFQYDDELHDDYEREPFSVLFQVGHGSSAYRFAVGALHATPDDAVMEIILLPDVIRNIKSTFSTENVLLVGDLNADCSYCSKDDLIGRAIYSSTYTWLIDWSADTTVKDSTDCAYDRIIGTSHMMDALAAGTNQVYRFDTALGLNEQQAYAVSDHYPVEVELHIPG